MLIAEIIPSRRLPKHLAFFDYLVPAEQEGEIKPGQVVEIPFQGTKLAGLVLRLKKESNVSSLKPIHRILAPEPLFPPALIDLTFWLAKYYLVSPALVVHSFLPDIPKRTSAGTSIDRSYLKTAAPTFKIPAVDADRIKKLIPKITHREKPTLVHFTTLVEKIVLYLLLIHYYRKKGQTVQLIVPELHDLELLVPLLQQRFPGQMAILHGGLTKNQFFGEWEKIMRSEANIILGTRIALFAPIAAPGLTIVDQEENSNHKQTDQNPRYHVITVAARLSEMTKSKLVLTSCCPRLESYHRVVQKEYDYLKISKQRRMVHLIDLNEEVQRKNYSLISDRLETLIGESLRLKRPVVLFLNRKGMALRVTCQDCDYQFICQQCQLPLIYDQTQEKLICRHCHHQEAIPELCPRCRGTLIRYAGRGTQTVEREIKHRFPAAKVCRWEKGLQPPLSHQDIIIGTEVLLSAPPLKAGLLGLASADTILTMPDFRSGERTFQLVSRLQGLFPEADLVIQTYVPTHPAFQAVIRGDYEWWYQKEIVERKDFFYPPFSRLIKLTLQHRDRGVAEREAQKIYRQLSEYYNQTPKVIIMEPQVTAWQVHHKFHWQIIIKTPLAHSLKELITLVPDNWQIDIDPVSLL